MGLKFLYLNKKLCAIACLTSNVVNGGRNIVTN